MPFKFPGNPIKSHFAIVVPHENHGEAAMELKFGRWIGPVLKIRSPVPSEGRTNIGLDGMLKLAGDVFDGPSHGGRQLERDRKF